MSIHPSFFHSEPHWPPSPHPLTGLRLSGQSEWGIEQWKMYAQILEEAGYYLLEALSNTDEKLRESEARKSRPQKRDESKPAIELLPGKTLLSSAETYARRPPIPRRGRPLVGKARSKKDGKRSRAKNKREELMIAIETEYAKMKASPFYKKPSKSGALRAVLPKGESLCDHRSILNDPRIKALK